MLKFTSFFACLLAAVLAVHAVYLVMTFPPDLTFEVSSFRRGSSRTTTLGPWALFIFPALIAGFSYYTYGLIDTYKSKNIKPPRAVSVLTLILIIGFALTQWVLVATATAAAAGLS